MCTSQTSVGVQVPGSAGSGITQAVRTPSQERRLDAYFDGFPPEWNEFKEQVLRLAPQDTNLLLTGETGTGKTRLGRLVHELSSRASEPFVIVDCGALPASLMESEMFGHVRGAFTGADRARVGKFASAGRGTILLDEINSLPISVQGKLLRIIEDRVYEPVGSNSTQPMHARIITASNACLEEEVTAGRFRADLFFRLNVVGFFLPPLRNRVATILPLSHQFLVEFASRNRPDVSGFTPAALRALQEYHWPGNIRELRNVTERAVALCRGPLIDVNDLPENLRGRVGPSTPVEQAFELQAVNGAPASATLRTLAESKEAAEIERIKEALAKHRNNRLRAASELGISRMGLYKKLHKYGLAPRKSDRRQEQPALAPAE